MSDLVNHDVFICHASEDKDDFVRPLGKVLLRHNSLIHWNSELMPVALLV